MTTERTTHTIDATGKVLGRLATEVAVLLRGKNKLGFTFHQDHGDRVVVTNADKIRVTGRKATQKKYFRHSTFPGGLTEMTFAQMMVTKPEEVVELAIKNMLPDNRLRKIWLKRLIIKRGESHAS